MKNIISKVEKGFHLIFIFLIFVCFLFIFLNINRGLDFTDESYSLLRSLYPDLEIGKITYFGYLNNLLLKIFNQNLNYLKIFNIFLLTISFINLSIIFQKTVKLITNYNYRINLLIIVSLLGIINFYSGWRFTPSYDYYNLLGFILYLSGVLIFHQNKELNQNYNLFYYYILISLGLFLCLISKPSTFIILSLLTILLCFFVTHKKLIFFINCFSSILIALFLFIIFLKLINITPSEYLNDIKYGSDIKKLQDPRYDVQFLILGSIKQVIFFLYQNIYLFILIPIIIFVEKKFFESKNNLIIIYVSLIFLIFNSPLLTISVLSFYIIITKFDYLKKDFLKIIFLPFILFCGYFAISIGTNTNFITHLKKSDFILFLIFYYFFTFLKIDKKYDNRIKDNLFLIVIFIFILGQLSKGILKPYRLHGSIFNQSKKIEVKSFKNNFYIDEINKDFIVKVQRIFKQNGWQEGNNLIELSGRYPVFNIILDAKYVSKPWYLGGYEGSTNFVRGFFAETDKNLIKKSWIITSDYKYGISEELLKEFNIDLAKNYNLIEIFEDQIRGIKFYIYKPK